MLRRIKRFLVTVGMGVGAISAARADMVMVFENGESGFTVSTTGTNTTFTIAHGCGFSTEACTVWIQAKNPSWQAQFTPGNFDVYDLGGTTVSDYVDVFPLGGSFYGIEFQSDTGETGLAPRIIAANIMETGQPQTLFTATWSDAGRLVGTDTIQIQSDLDLLVVPEPPSLMLLLMCVVALAYMKRRRRIVGE